MRLAAVAAEEKAGRNPWASVAGPIAATIATLQGLGWQPLSPNIWRTPSGEQQATIADNDADDEEIKDTIVEHAAARAWREVARHYQGKGLERGPSSLRPALSAKKWLQRKGFVAQAAALKTVMSEGAAYGDRFGEVGARCKICGSSDDTPKHRYWKCRGLSEIDEKEVGAISKSRYLEIYVDDEADANSCLWYRALVPGDLAKPQQSNITQEEQITAATVCQIGSFDGESGAKTVASDGAGGPETVPRDSLQRQAPEKTPRQKPT